MNSIWFMIASLFIIIFEGYIYKRIVFKGLDLKRRFSSTGVFPGETFTLQFTLTNNKILPVSWLEVRQVFPRGLNFSNENATLDIGMDQYIHRLSLYILPFQKVYREYPLMALQRGYYEINSLNLESSNIFGTEKYNEHRNIPAFISVFPKVRDMKNALSIATSFQGETPVKRWIMDDPLTILGIRNYQNSDSLKNINWKATAKTGVLKVNTHEFTADTKALVLYNLEADADIWKGQSYDLIESTIEACASVVSILMKQGIPTGFATNALMAGEHYNEYAIRYGSDQKHFKSILDSMAKIQMYKKNDLADIIRMIKGEITWGTVVLIVTPIIKDELLQSIKELAIQNIKILTMERKENKLGKGFDIFYYKGEDKNEKS